MYIIILNNINNNLRRCKSYFVGRLTWTRRLPICNLPTLFQITNNQFGSKRMSSLANNLFLGNLDRFDGVTVDSLEENCKLEDFSLKLTESLKSWLSDKKRAIWFKVALEHSAWVPILQQNGFNFHHAKPGFVMMYKWIAHESDIIPPYAHTLFGVGGVVVNDKSQVLVVKDKYLAHNQWKFPGGYVEPGENLVDAAIREVFEETNIKTEFTTLVSLRQTHHGMFGCSDIYVVVALKPLSTEIKISEREINEGAWLDVDEYVNNPEIHDFNRFVLQCYINYKKNNLTIDLKHGIHQILKKPYTIYYMTTKR